MNHPLLRNVAAGFLARFLTTSYSKGKALHLTSCQVHCFSQSGLRIHCAVHMTGEHPTYRPRKFGCSPNRRCSQQIYARSTLVRNLLCDQPVGNPKGRCGGTFQSYLIKSNKNNKKKSITNQILTTLTSWDIDTSNCTMTGSDTFSTGRMYGL